MMRVIGQRIPLYAIAFAMVALPPWALADSSSVEDFTSIVNTGAIKQTTSGSGNTQDLNVGSANSTKANSFNATVTTGSITQSSSGSGIVQSANIGSTNNAKVDSFTATVTTGKIEQISNRSGDRQEMDIGSVNNSTVNGAFKANVKVKEGVKQTGSGEVVLGSVKNSNVQDFSTTLEVKGKVTGNNIRIGSIVGGERFDKHGRSQKTEQSSSNSSDESLKLPDLTSTNIKQKPTLNNLEGALNYVNKSKTASDLYKSYGDKVKFISSEEEFIKIYGDTVEYQKNKDFLGATLPRKDNAFIVYVNPNLIEFDAAVVIAHELIHVKNNDKYSTTGLNAISPTKFEGKVYSKSFVNYVQDEKEALEVNHNVFIELQNNAPTSQQHNQEVFNKSFDPKTISQHPYEEAQQFDFYTFKTFIPK